MHVIASFSWVMVRLLASSVVDCVFQASSPCLVKPKTIKLVFAASSHNTQHLRSKSKGRLSWNSDIVSE